MSAPHLLLLQLVDRGRDALELQQELLLRTRERAESPCARRARDERERERERVTDRERETDRETETGRERERQTESAHASLSVSKCERA